jgi:hypothetical protein
MSFAVVVAAAFAVVASAAAQQQCPVPTLCGLSCKTVLENIECDASSGDGWTALAQQYCAYEIELAAGRHTDACDAAAARAAALLNASCALGALSCNSGAAAAASLLTVQLEQCLGAQAPCTGAAARLPCNNQRRQPYNSVGVMRLRVPNLSYYAMHDEMAPTACDGVLGSFYTELYSSFDALSLLPANCSQLADQLWPADELRYRGYFVLYPTLDNDGVRFENFNTLYTTQPSELGGVPELAYPGDTPTMLLFENASLAIDHGAAAFDAVLFSHGWQGAPLQYAYTAAQWAASGRIVVLASSADEDLIFRQYSISTQFSDPAALFGYTRALSYYVTDAFEFFQRAPLHRQQFLAALQVAPVAGGPRFADLYSGSVSVGGHSIGVSTATLLSGVDGVNCSYGTYAWMYVPACDENVDPFSCAAFFAQNDETFIDGFCNALIAASDNTAYWNGGVTPDGAFGYAPFTPLLPPNYVADSGDTGNGTALRLDGLVGGIYIDGAVFTAFADSVTDPVLGVPYTDPTPAFYDAITASLPSALFVQPQIGFMNYQPFLVMYSQYYAPFDVAVASQWPAGADRFKVFLQYGGETSHVAISSIDLCSFFGSYANQSTAAAALFSNPFPLGPFSTDTVNATAGDYYRFFCNQPMAAPAPASAPLNFALATLCMCNQQTSRAYEEQVTLAALDFLDAVSPGRQWCAEQSRLNLNATATANSTGFVAAFCADGLVAAPPPPQSSTCCAGTPSTVPTNWAGLADADCQYAVNTLGAQDLQSLPPPPNYGSTGRVSLP